MRKRKYVIGVIAGLVASLAVSGIAQAAQSQSLTVSVGASKQDAKLRGPADINVTVDTVLDSPNPVNQTAQQTVLTFDGDFDLGNTANYPTCNPSILAGTTTAQAIAACGAGAPGGNATVGSGNSTVCSALLNCGGQSVPGVVTAFNGTPSGGNPQIVLHNRIGPPINVTTVLPGVLNGSTLTVQVPDTSATGLHLTHFFTGVPILKTGTGVAASAAKKKKKKKKAAPIYYITAKCSDGTWSTSETTTFRAGGAPKTATATTPCTKKPPAKKKKKKKK